MNSSCSNDFTTPEIESVVNEKEGSNKVVDKSLYLANNKDSILVVCKKAREPFKGTIILLPGWNYNHKHWTDSSIFLDIATSRGYNVIMPDVRKTIYSQEIYPETRSDWKNEVTRDWLNSVLMSTLNEKFKINSNKLFAVGISTGGRGALFLAMENQDVFTAGASLSGDYDQSQFPNDNLYRGFYGKQELFPDRYKGIENPITQLIGLKIPYYFSHAKDDNVVPVHHTMHLKEHLTLVSPQNKCEFHFSNQGGHQYAYWDLELKKVLDFFDAQ